MQFKPEMCQAVLSGAKAQTRRLVKYGDGKLNLGEQLWFMQGVGSNIGSIFQDGRNRTPTVVTRWRYSPYRIKWQVGRTYAIQPGRGKKAVGRFLLLSIRRERLREISWQDAIEEGIEAFQGDFGIATFRDSLGNISQGLTTDAFAHLWDCIHAKASTRWNDNPSVWVLSFTLCEKPENE